MHQKFWAGLSFEQDYVIENLYRVRKLLDEAYAITNMVHLHELFGLFVFFVCIDTIKKISIITVH